MTKGRKILNSVLICCGVLILTAGLIIFLVKLVPVPPVNNVKQALAALSDAAAGKADIYSPKLYGEASALYDSAMLNWQKENKRFIYSRNYSRADSFADLSARKARQSAKISRNHVTDLTIRLPQNMEKLNSMVGQLDKRFSSYPLPVMIRKNISNGKLLLKESEVAYKKGDYSLSKARAAESESLLAASYEYANNHLEEYFSSYHLWKTWADRAINESRRIKGYSIIVDKYSRKCLVYHAGVKKHEFNVELGQNWVGHKQVKGDKKTPEGYYHVTKKLGAGKTKYHKALLINYPNDNDRMEYKKGIANGSLPANASLGSMIEIHGDGGRGIDWTDGCVALTNSEMDVVFKIAGEGTPVAIIGSMLNLDQLTD